MSSSPTQSNAEHFAAVTLTMLAKLVEDHDAASFTIKRFRQRHGLSESQYHKLQREGRGPREMSVGVAGKRISRAAELAWIADREAELQNGGCRPTAAPINP